MLKKNVSIDVELIYANLDKETLPKNFVEDFISQLKSELMNDYFFNNILSENTIYEKVVSIELLLKEYLESDFDFTSFLESYRNNALNNIMQVNYFGLSLSSEVKKVEKG